VGFDSGMQRAIVMATETNLDLLLDKTTEDVMEAINNRSLVVLPMENEMHQAVRQLIGQGFAELGRMLMEGHTRHLRILHERLVAINGLHERNMEQLHLQMEERNQELLQRAYSLQEKLKQDLRLRESELELTRGQVELFRQQAESYREQCSTFQGQAKAARRNLELSRARVNDKSMQEIAKWKQQVEDLKTEMACKNIELERLQLQLGIFELDSALDGKSITEVDTESEVDSEVEVVARLKAKSKRRRSSADSDPDYKETSRRQRRNQK